MTGMLRKILWTVLVSCALSATDTLRAQSDTVDGELPVATSKRCKQTCKKEACGACTPSAQIPAGLTFELGCCESCQADAECANCCFRVEVMASGRPDGSSVPLRAVTLCQVNNTGCIAGTEVIDQTGPRVIEEDVTLNCSIDAESSACIKATADSGRIIIGAHWKYTLCAKLKCGFCEG